METKLSKNGRRLFTIEQKKKIVEEMASCTAAEVSRRYDIGVGMLYRWRQQMEDGQNTALRSGEAPVPASELKKARTLLVRPNFSYQPVAFPSKFDLVLKNQIFLRRPIGSQSLCHRTSA